MYGYIVFGVTVSPKGDFPPAQIDSLDGGTLDFAMEWDRFFGTRPSERDLKTRRYWDTNGPQTHAEPGSPHHWSKLQVGTGRAASRATSSTPPPAQAPAPFASTTPPPTTTGIYCLDRQEGVSYSSQLK